MKKVGRPRTNPGEVRGKMTFSFSQDFINKIRIFSSKKNIKLSNLIEELLTVEMSKQ
jgi:hypothetical protein